ncbi:OmpH family outer membrane protein, partial [Hoylesella shahii]|uniref:OmpH family outer membrane protein n=1 Tax=Hoylesella shahii TaxID=228603 RepID=UPI0028EED4EB
MNKKKFFGTLAIAAMATVAFSSCNKQNEQVEKKSETAPKSEVGSLKIAYVEVDSIMTQYKFCKDYSLILQKKGQNIQSTLASKQQALQAAAANFQQKVQQNAYTREQAEAIQAGLQNQNDDIKKQNK